MNISGFPLSDNMAGGGFPLSDVTISETLTASMVKVPSYSADSWQVNQEEFALQVPGVGSFYARDGRVVEYSVVPGADREWVKLHLNGQVVVALLHQRKIINFHASSFIYNGLGVMVLGETGAGKSSLTLAFALNGGGFLTDDLTPVVFDGSAPLIMPLRRKVKIRKDTAVQLGIDPHRLSEAECGTGKKYFSLQPVQLDPYQLDVIIRVDTAAVNIPVFSISGPAERFSLLRSEVCSWEILTGMPETEMVYMQQLSVIVQKTEFIRVERPADITINDLFFHLREYLQGLKPRGEK